MPMKKILSFLLIGVQGHRIHFEGVSFGFLYPVCGLNKSGFAGQRENEAAIRGILQYRSCSGGPATQENEGGEARNPRAMGFLDNWWYENRKVWYFDYDCMPYELDLFLQAAAMRVPAIIFNGPNKESSATIMKSQELYNKLQHELVGRAANRLQNELLIVEAPLRLPQIFFAENCSFFNGDRVRIDGGDILPTNLCHSYLLTSLIFCLLWRAVQLRWHRYDVPRGRTHEIYPIRTLLDAGMGGRIWSHFVTSIIFMISSHQYDGFSIIFLKTIQGLGYSIWLIVTLAFAMTSSKGWGISRLGLTEREIGSIICYILIGFSIYSIESAELVLSFNIFFFSLIFISLRRSLKFIRVKMAYIGHQINSREILHEAQPGIPRLNQAVEFSPLTEPLLSLDHTGRTVSESRSIHQEESVPIGGTTPSALGQVGSESAFPPNLTTLSAEAFPARTQEPILFPLDSRRQDLAVKYELERSQFRTLIGLGLLYLTVLVTVSIINLGSVPQGLIMMMEPGHLAFSLVGSILLWMNETVFWAFAIYNLTRQDGIRNTVWEASTRHVPTRIIPLYKVDVNQALNPSVDLPKFPPQILVLVGPNENTLIGINNNAVRSSSIMWTSLSLGVSIFRDIIFNSGEPSNAWDESGLYDQRYYFYYQLSEDP